MRYHNSTTKPSCFISQELHKTLLILILQWSSIFTIFQKDYLGFKKLQNHQQKYIINQHLQNQINRLLRISKNKYFIAKLIWSCIPIKLHTTQKQFRFQYYRYGMLPKEMVNIGYLDKFKRVLKFYNKQIEFIQMMQANNFQYQNKRYLQYRLSF
ncbi:unnamed protein product [Paramecium primaurelia]|uniref:Uncharacterized protein n=1 Tax=Paramecium primaurelia TaxID=5886 RepID=A0A8S1K1W6_PARPR|nr:unnamed protein product [Paramecium primaurelia]